MSLLYRALLGALLLSFLPVLLADSFSFNPIYIPDCLEVNENGGCSFSNASLWIDNSNPNATNATLPGPNDDVTIASPDPSLVLQIDYDAQFASLSISNASLSVGVNSTLTTNSLFLGEDSNLLVENAARVFAEAGNNTFTLTPTATIYVNSGGVFRWLGIASFLGTINVETNATFDVDTASVFAPVDATFQSEAIIGYLTVSNSVTFASGLETFGLTVSPNTTVTIGHSFFGAVFVDQSATVIFELLSKFDVYSTSEPALSGSGVLTIIGSYGVINSTTPATFNGTLNLEGTSITLAGLTLPNVVANNVSTITANGLVLNGNNVTQLAQLVAVGNGLTISGSPYYADVTVISSSLTVSGVFFPTQLTLTNASRINLSGLIHATVAIPPASTLSVTSPSQIVGSLVNQGSVNVTTTNYLDIWSGDYTQNGGTFSVELDTTDQASLNVLNGSIFLNGGGIQFSIKDKPFLKSAKFLVAQANASINGTFAGDATPLEGSSISRSLSVKYDQNPNAIYIQYSFNPKDVEYWMWIVLGVGLAVVIVVIVAVVVKCRRRTEYETLGR